MSLFIFILKSYVFRLILKLCSYDNFACYNNDCIGFEKKIWKMTSISSQIDCATEVVNNNFTKLLYAYKNLGSNCFKVDDNKYRKV